MSLNIVRCDFETDRGTMAPGYALHIEIGKLILDFTVAWG